METVDFVWLCRQTDRFSGLPSAGIRASKCNWQNKNSQLHACSFTICQLRHAVYRITMVLTYVDTFYTERWMLVWPKKSLLFSIENMSTEKTEMSLFIENLLIALRLHTHLLTDTVFLRCFVKYFFPALLCSTKRISILSYLRSIHPLRFANTLMMDCHSWPDAHNPCGYWQLRESCGGEKSHYSVKLAHSSNQLLLICAHTTVSEQWDPESTVFVYLCAFFKWDM